MMNDYSAFLEDKRQLGGQHGFEPVFMPDYLKDFQKFLVDYSIRMGRSALFEDCGLGKTVQQLVWAENVHRNTGGNVLILAPVAVSLQTVHEAEKFGIEVCRSRDGKPCSAITITHYEQVHKFDPKDFVGVVCDESSILKNFKGSLKKSITTFMKKLPYRLLATATPSPNDFIELGTSSEALGYLGYMDMLNKFFKNDQNNSKVGRHRGQTVKWRLKGHAETPFWRWVCSWSRAVRKPSDLGFDDTEFVLPGLIENEYMVEASSAPDGMLFSLPATCLKEQREERRRTINERCDMVSDVINKKTDSSIAWCHLNDEGDILEKSIKDCVQVSGRDSDDKKEEKLLAFAKGEIKCLVTKPSIGAWGLNFQHCNHMTFFPSHSFEQYYQAVRRCWRFGQKREVTVDMVTTEGEGRVIKNLKRKSEQADKMFDNLIMEMNNVLNLSSNYDCDKEMEIPLWV